MNKLFILSAISVLTLSACGGEDTKTTVKDSADKAIAIKEMTKDAPEKAKIVAPANPQKAQAVEEAKMITKAFGGALKAELKAAIKAGGPINALDVCNTKAGPIAETVAKEKNASISRVSLKNRNPDNIPNAWQKTVLEDFNARAAKGEDIQKMGFTKIEEHDGKKQLHFMKALPVGEPCLACHGSKIDDKVQAKLTELYPQDKATGYEKGQVRGAIVIVKDLK